jgi:hypothetical protein
MARDRGIDPQAGILVTFAGFGTMMAGAAGASGALLGKNPMGGLNDAALIGGGAMTMGAGISMLLIR